LAVLIRLFTYLVNFRLDRSGSVSDILLGGATARSQGDYCNTRRREKYFHTSNLDGPISNQSAILDRPVF
jgi:hypothetical protein